MELQFTAPTLIELIVITLLIIVGGVVAWLFRKIERINHELSSLQRMVKQRTDELDAELRNIGHQQNEAQARTLVATRHVQDLQQKQDEFDNQLRELKLQDPSLRLYQKAAELVKQGATIDDVMEACDIPRAEAEMLFMVHKTS